MMLNSGALGVVLGLVLIYFLLSTLCSLVQEVIEAFIGRRADFLEAGIADLIGPTLTQTLFAHPLTQALASDKGPPGIASWVSHLLTIPARWIRSFRNDRAQRNRPSYLSGAAFSKNLLSVFVDGSAILGGDIRAAGDASSFSVERAIGLPDDPGFHVQIDDEIMLVRSIDGATWTVARHEDGTNAAEHRRGAGITRIRTDSAVLATDVDATATSVQVTSDVGLPSKPGFTVRIDKEIVRVSKIEGTTWAVVRGQAGTAAADHQAGSAALLIRTASEAAGELRTVIGRIPEGSVRARLLSMLDDATNDLDGWRQDLEAGFNEKMDRVSGWYKRRTKTWLFAIGLLVAVLMNVDTTTLTRELWINQTLRDSVANAASSIVQTPAGARARATASEDVCPIQPTSTPAGGASASPSPISRDSLQCIQQSIDSLKNLGLPMGWPSWHWSKWGSTYAQDPRVPHDGTEVWLKIAGLLLTALALTLGAPFWFDLLNRVANLRSSGNRPAPDGPRDSK